MPLNEAMLSIDAQEQPQATRLRQTYRPPRVTIQVEGGDEEDEDYFTDTPFNPAHREPQDGSSSRTIEIPREIDPGRLHRRQSEEPQRRRRGHTLPAPPVQSFSHYNSYGGGQAIPYGQHPGGYFNRPDGESHFPQPSASHYGHSGIPYPPPQYPPYQYPGYPAGPSYPPSGHSTPSGYGPVYQPSAHYTPSTYGSNPPFGPPDPYLHQSEQQLPIQSSPGLDRETLEIRRENYRLKQEAREMRRRRERRKLRAEEEARKQEKEEAEREQAKKNFERKIEDETKAKIEKENQSKQKKKSKKTREEDEIESKKKDIRRQIEMRQAQAQAEAHIAAVRKEELSTETQHQRPVDDTGRILLELLKFMEKRFGGQPNQTLPPKSVSNASMGMAGRDRGRTELWRRNLEQANFDGLMRLQIEEVVEDVLQRHSEYSQNGDFEATNDGLRAFSGTSGFHSSSTTAADPNDRISVSALTDIINRMALSLRPKFAVDNLHASQIPLSPQPQPSVKSFKKNDEPLNREDYYDGYESASDIRNRNSWNNQEDAQFVETRRRVGKVKGATNKSTRNQIQEENDYYTDESEDQGLFSRSPRRYAAVRQEKERRGHRSTRKEPPSGPPVPDPPPKKRGSEEFRQEVLHD